MKGSADFKGRFGAYREAIDADIVTYGRHVRAATASQYGEAASKVTGAFLDLLEGNGKRVRGTLVMVGYEMMGGQDKTMIIRAATALEMIHNYMLIVDDIQDRSVLRRGRQTVHTVLSATFTGQPDEHVGTAMALNAALTGAHAAQMLIAGLNVEPDLARKALGIINHTMIVTAHGQTYDMLYSLPGARPDEAALARVRHWKTAEYTVLNPLCVGMVLAGAGCEDTDAVREYALHVGQAFQIADDIAGVFGRSTDSGKETGEDIREGKQTLLTAYALRHTAGDDAATLRDCLGNAALDEASLERCKAIFERCGAKAHAVELLRSHGRQAVTALEQADRAWQPSQVAFLRQLAEAVAAV